MTSRLLLAVTSFAALVTVASCGADATTEPGTFGLDVVESVVDRIKAACIFNYDHDFLRRLAYVETEDGTDTHTYRQGYNGGIWKVDEDMFNATRDCHSIIQQTCDRIQQNFNISWPTVTWPDLRKPLYSALAAILYLEQRMATNITGTEIPASVENQTDFVTHYYHFGEAASNFSEADEVLQFDCEFDMDLAFILDSSNNISDIDWSFSLEFVAQVVDVMNVPDPVRVASVIFADNSSTVISFNSYNNKSEVVSDILKIQRMSGETNTHIALDAARSLFSSSGRNQSSTKSVAVLVTDGRSNLTLTSGAAERLRDEGVTVFAIGVGGYNADELLDVASEPKCAHVYLMKNFADIGKIVTEVQRSICTANKQLPRNGTITTFTSKNETTLTDFESNTTTPVLTVTCGILNIYVSYDNPNPNPSFFTDYFMATEDHPAYLTARSTDHGRPVYMTVIGTDLPPTVQALRNCSDFHYDISIAEKDWELQCCRGNSCEVCSDEELRQEDRIKEVVCDAEEEAYDNPCTLEALESGENMFPYPYDPSKFILCDFRGKPYITKCPDRESFNPRTKTCGYDAPLHDRLHPLEGAATNPCTPKQIIADNYYFAYHAYKNKYILCDHWGDAWVENCSHAHLVWDQEQLDCVAKTTDPPKAPPGEVDNPCTSDAVSSGQFYHVYPCDPTRFIHCDVALNYWVQRCPDGMKYDSERRLCSRREPPLTSQQDCSE